MGLNGSSSLCSQAFWAQNHKWTGWTVRYFQTKIFGKTAVQAEFFNTVRHHTCGTLLAINFLRRLITGHVTTPDEVLLCQPLRLIGFFTTSLTAQVLR